MIYDTLRYRQKEILFDLSRSYPANFLVNKKDLIDFAFHSYRIRRVAELGGVWAVDGAYGLYVAEKYRPLEIIMIDIHWSDRALKVCGALRSVTIIKDNFGKPEVARSLQVVDAVILFDVLLHQVTPDWKEVLKMYAPHTRSFLIVNPQLTGTRESIRLMDLGREEYFNSIPHAPTGPLYGSLWTDWEAKTGRDWNEVWQWGITNLDLYEVMDRLGFELAYMQDHGQLERVSNFHHCSFAFVTRERATAIHRPGEASQRT